MGKLGKVLEAPFRTGKSAATRTANRANSTGEALSARLLDLQEDQFKLQEPLQREKVAGGITGIKTLQDLLKNVNTPREIPELPDVITRDEPRAVNLAVQAARTPFSSARRAARRRLGGGGATGGQLSSALRGLDLQEAREGSRAAFNTQENLRNDRLRQLERNEGLEYSFDLAEQQRPFTQAQQLVSLLLGLKTSNPALGGLASALQGSIANQQNIAANAFRDVGPGIGTKLLSSYLGGAKFNFQGGDNIPNISFG